MIRNVLNHKISPKPEHCALLAADFFFLLFGFCFVFLSELISIDVHLYMTFKGVHLRNLL